jgi:hypothetical protein
LKRLIRVRFPAALLLKGLKMPSDEEPGWDHFTPNNAKTFDIKVCRVCNSPFNITKGVIAATSGGEARIGKKHKHDELNCPHAGKDWHNQVLDIRKEAEKTSSVRLRTILLDEAEDLVRLKKATIPNYQKKWFV